MGPEGGEAGGRVIAKGTVAEVASTPGSYTGDWLRKLLESEKKWPPAKNAAPREFWPAVAPAEGKPNARDAAVKSPKGALAALAAAVSSPKGSLKAAGKAALDVFGRKPGVTGEEAEAEVARKRGRPRKTIRV
jgi:excinuclease ABC subunit A